MPRPARVLLTACLLVGPLGCVAAELPGEVVGKYAISSNLRENTCGLNALPTPGSFDYTVELRAKDGVGYWLVGRPPATVGLFSANGSFQFESEQSYDVREPQAATPSLAELDPLKLYHFDATEDPADNSALPPCTIVIRERSRGQVFQGAASDAGAAAEADLTGENSIAMSATPGSSCARVLQANGGPFEALPCSATFDLEGALIEADGE